MNHMTYLEAYWVQRGLLPVEYADHARAIDAVGERLAVAIAANAIKDIDEWARAALADAKVTQLADGGTRP